MAFARPVSPWGSHWPLPGTPTWSLKWALRWPKKPKPKGGDLVLGPTVNMHRSPLNGRNFECFSEDPHLTARLAVAYIRGMQSKGVGATVKHFIANDFEYQRKTMSSEVDERTLREIYLPPFQAAVQEAQTWSLMSSYNRLNGTYCSDDEDLLTKLLRDEWGYDGMVVSDWGGTYSTAASVIAGMDLEMPGPSDWRGEKLLAAFEQGLVPEEAIDKAVGNILRVIQKRGDAIHDPSQPEQAIDRPEHRALIRRAGGESIVLLKNQGDLLPLSPEKAKKIAIIGPNAKTAQIMGGGSSMLRAHYRITPYDGLVSRAGDQFELRYALGCNNFSQLPRLDIAQVFTGPEQAETGIKMAFFNSTDCSGDPVAETLRYGTEYEWAGNLPAGVDPKGFSVQMKGYFVPAVEGTQTLSLVSMGLSRMHLNGLPVIDNWEAQLEAGGNVGESIGIVSAEVALQAGQPVELVVEYTQGGADYAFLTIGHKPPDIRDDIQAAEKLAADSDIALVFVGSSGENESEGRDRQHMDLVQRQNELVSRVAAANPNTVVVLQTGSPVTMPWLDQVPVVLQAWFPGQECGNAIADVLFGDRSPAGKLPQTFPVRLEDNPAYLNYPGDEGRVRYGEGIYIGYRYYEKKKIAPLFPFGHGLSYTSFGYENLALSAAEITPDQELTVSIDITNTGDRPGAEVVQLYLRDETAAVSRPEKELKAFAKVALEPGETQTVQAVIRPKDLAYWSVARGSWFVEAGEFTVLVGSSSQDIRAQARFRLGGSGTV